MFGLVALFGFALSLRMDSPSFRVIRGARLHVDGRGLKASAPACAAECRIHGDGVAAEQALLSGLLKLPNGTRGKTLVEARKLVERDESL